MPLSDFTRKPKLRYTPETVITTDPGTILQDVSSVDISEWATTESDIKDTISILQDEIDNIQLLQDAILDSIPDDPISVPQELIDSIGKQSITKTDYMAAISSESAKYGPIPEIFEEYHLDLSYTNSSPHAVSLSIFEELKQALFTDIELLEYELNTGVESVHLSALSNKKHVKDLTDVLKLDASKAKGIRREFIKAAKVGAMQIQKAVVRYLLLGKSANNSNNSRATIVKLQSTLKAIRGSLMFYGTLYATDTKSLLNNIRSLLLNKALDLAYSKVMSTYYKLRASMVSPITDMLANTNIPLSNKSLDSDAINSLTNTLLGAVDAVTEKYRRFIADFYRRKRKRYNLAFNSVRKIKMMLFCKRWIVGLDSAISGISRALETGTLKGWEVEELTSALNRKSANTKSILTNPNVVATNEIGNHQPDTEEQSLPTLDGNVDSDYVEEYINEDITTTLLVEKYKATTAKTSIDEYLDESRKLAYEESLADLPEDTIGGDSAINSGSIA